MIISAGVPAPEIELMDEAGVIRKLSSYQGRSIVLYFYPKDDTPGCTAEACAFREDYSAYEQAGVVILGVSPDSPKSHLKFKEKHHLPFTLLADESHQACEAYGVWGLKKMIGREYYGVFRTTFVIGPDGIIRKVFEDVKPAEHSAEVLAAFK